MAYGHFAPSVVVVVAVVVRGVVVVVVVVVAVVGFVVVSDCCYWPIVRLLFPPQVTQVQTYLFLRD